ncbi:MULTISPECIES: hypothetical protein [unclassified Clostridium]|uniref:hypothetical protein n=1 Tax=unclassified Clostridium TaxID=2614128 RepID=UPI00207A34A0|nr:MULTISPECIES: hypothetical protein [unclassified Clostridium]
MNSLEIIKNRLKSIMEVMYNEDEIEKNEGLDLLIIDLQEIVDDLQNDNNSRLEEYIRILKSIRDIRPSYLELVIDNIYIISIIIFKVLTNIEYEGLEDGEEENKFQILSIENETNLFNCFFIDEEEFSSSMLYCNLKNIDELKNFIEGIDNYNVYKLLISLIEQIELTNLYGYILLIKQSTEANILARVDFLKINQVMDGKVINTPIEFNNYIENNIKVKFNNDLKYNQFSEIIEILNEYNMHSYILDKYLRIYQILENFMYKSKICELSNNMDYRMLTIRDFKKLNEAISKNEYETLGDFIKKVGQVEFDGKLYKDILMENWESTRVKTSEDVRKSLEKCFKLLDIKDRKNKEYNIKTIDKDTLVNVFSNLIYNIRNSIVHNKVNEFHLSYSNLDSDIIFILERFVMGSLENIIYGLILNKNSVVWYDQSKLLLY